MAGITFGSVGDIIAVGEIAWAIAKALNSSRGSAKEYQSLVRELQLFNKALLQVIAVWQNYADSPELQELGQITNEAIKEWKNTLFEFQSKLDKKYATSLAPGGTKNWFKDAGKKVAWVKEKEDVLELRRKLHMFSNTLTMLSDAAQKKSDRLAEKDQKFRVQAVNYLLQESVKLAEQQLAQFKAMNEKMDCQAQTSALILSSMKGGIITLSQVKSIVIDIKSLLELFHKMILSQQSVPRGLGGHWKQAPVILELATGKEIPLPLELVSSWEIFDLLLSGLFKHQPAAQKKIQRGEFAIEENDTGRDVNRTWEIDMSFRPGQKVDMSMIFSDRDAADNTCPRCKTVTSASCEDRIQCVCCKMWFQRLTEVEEEFEELAVEPEVRRAPSMTKGTTVPVQATGPVLGPADFARVRLMRKVVSQLSGVIGGTPMQRTSRYTKALKSSLRESGLDDVQIEQVLNKEEEIDPDRPTFTRIGRRHLSLDTLTEFDIDFEIDTDPQYILITRWVPEYEQNFLWSHTRKLRERREELAVDNGYTSKSKKKKASEIRSGANDSKSNSDDNRYGRSEKVGRTRSRPPLPPEWERASAFASQYMMNARAREADDEAPQSPSSDDEQTSQKRPQRGPDIVVRRLREYYDYQPRHRADGQGYSDDTDKSQAAPTTSRSSSRGGNESVIDYSDEELAQPGGSIPPKESYISPRSSRGGGNDSVIDFSTGSGVDSDEDGIDHVDYSVDGVTYRRFRPRRDTLVTNPYEGSSPARIASDGESDTAPVNERRTPKSPEKIIVESASRIAVEYAELQKLGAKAQKEELEPMRWQCDHPDCGRTYLQLEQLRRHKLDFGHGSVSSMPARRRRSEKSSPPPSLVRYGEAPSGAPSHYINDGYSSDEDDYFPRRGRSPPGRPITPDASPSGGAYGYSPPRRGFSPRYTSSGYYAMAANVSAGKSSEAAIVQDQPISLPGPLSSDPTTS